MKVLSVSAIVIIIDQISKLMVKGISISYFGFNISGLARWQKISILGRVFNITFVENPGIAFGINLGNNFKLLISVFTLVATLGLLYYIFRNREKKLIFRLSLALILGGAVGNLIDRTFYGVIFGYAPLFYGKVVDFLDLRIFNLFIFNRTFNNYVFNFADVSVTAGVILLLFILNKQKNTNNNLNSNIEEALVENKD
ncbi:MAG TPA: signal peptidase II [Ignavibacteriaceae bacterium]|nr:signal peptidase II [Ignavibacteriaceae bacterium]